MSQEMQGPARAAAVLVSLDEDTAAEVLRRLGQSEIRMLATYADQLPIGDESVLEPALVAFEQLMEDPLPAILSRAGEHIRGLTRHALGPDLASRVLRDEELGAVAKLTAARADVVASLLMDEHPQVASAVLLQLPEERTAEILAAMPEESQSEIVTRIAGIQTIPSSLVAEASEALAASLAEADAVSSDDGAPSEVDGISFVAALLNQMGGEASERLLDAIADEDEDVGQQVRDAMFTFEDLMRVDERGLQVLMQEVPSDRMMAALKTSTPELRDKLLSVVSKRARESMLEDLAIMPPMRLSDVEAAQKEITETAMNLSEEGRIMLPLGGGEDMV